uniref:Disintegrin and metalloproteinase domain-containing protein 5-like n=1 Tax=Camelus bactrianus TaxID=9837 RepID=A0A9W3EUC5_CAMBA|nr:disintegrin and metalloproteinase domain-containing protein 5-like [Camelus bactrianus]
MGRNGRCGLFHRRNFAVLEITAAPWRSYLAMISWLRDGCLPPSPLKTADHPYPHKTFLQTTVPEKISSPEAIKDPENNVAYIITVEGKPYFVHLKKQSFLSSAFVVYYDKDDHQHSQPLLDQMDCSYHGYVAGFPNSLVSLNTCSGLRGILQFKNVSYGIEPMEAVSGFMHMIYEEKNDDSNIPLLWENDTYSYRRNSEYPVRKGSERPQYFKLFPQYLEMYIVVDKNMFDFMGSDIKAVTQKVIQIIGFVNSMLTQLKLTVRISAIEIWSKKNKISTIGNPNYILYKFLEWKYKSVTRPHHTAYLFAFKKHPTFIGATYPGKICNENYAGGVVLYPEGLSLESYSISVVQLLGLNMGLSFDNTEICHCSGDVCIMSSEAVHSAGVKDFSTCSLDDFKYFASHSGLECLRNIFPEKPAYKQGTVCGNGILEAGEECDCGTLQDCTHMKCCDPRTCRKKKRELVCGSGECCTTRCVLKPPGTVCREPVDECDFREYCSGTRPHCGVDTYARNGEICSGGSSFCFGGRCRSYTAQCKRLLGRGARGGPFACFDEINTRADKFGNCGRGFCDFRHALCGKLVCAWPHKAIVTHPNLSVIYTHVRGEICTSTFLHTDKPVKGTMTTIDRPEERDETFVEDGSMCGPYMFCLKFLCVEAKYQMNLRACNSDIDCHKNGTCNNFNHCQCKEGFMPPNCLPKEGEFGSIDDGHVIKSGKGYLEERSLTGTKHRFQLILYLPLPVLLITTAVIIKRNKIRQLCDRGETESETSVSEGSSTDSKLSPRR